MREVVDRNALTEAAMLKVIQEQEALAKERAEFEKMRELFSARQSFYAMAHEQIDNSNRPVADVVSDAVTLARTKAGW